MNGRGSIELADFHANANILMIACLEKRAIVVDEKTGTFCLGKHQIKPLGSNDVAKVSVMLINELLNSREKAQHHFTQRGQIQRIKDFYVEELTVIGDSLQKISQLPDNTPESVHSDQTQNIIRMIDRILDKNVPQAFGEVANAEERMVNEFGHSTEYNPEDLCEVEDPSSEEDFGAEDLRGQEPVRPRPKPTLPPRSVSPVESSYGIPREVLEEEHYGVKPASFKRQDDLSANYTLAMSYLNSGDKVDSTGFRFMESFKENLAIQAPRLIDPDNASPLNLPGMPASIEERQAFLQNLSGQIDQWLQYQVTMLQKEGLKTP